MKKIVLSSVLALGLVGCATGPQSYITGEVIRIKLT